MRFLKSIAPFLGIIFVFASVMFVRTPSADAAASLNRTYDATVTSSTLSGIARQLRLDQATTTNALYVLGTSVTNFGKLSEDGTSFSTVTYSSALPTHSAADMIMTNGKAYISAANSATPGFYRYDIDGGAANFVASTTLPSGSTSMSFNDDTNTVYVTKGSVIYSFETDLTRVTPTTTLVQAASRLSYGGGNLYYISTSGLLRKAILDGSPTLVNGVTDISLGSSGASASNIKGLVTSNDGSMIYTASSTHIAKRSATTGSIIWSVAASNIAAMDVSASTGEIFIVGSNGITRAYSPITPVTSASATASSTSAILDWTTGITDADFGGTTIVRSTSGYPTDVSDGTLVTSTSILTTFTDTGLSDGTYYYSFFNKTLDGYYSSAVTSSVTINLPPEAPFLVANGTGTSALLTWTTPADTAGFLLRRSTDDFPTGLGDGVTVTTTNNSVTSYTDSGLSDSVYYYGLFAVDAEGNYSTAATSTVTIDTTAPATPTIAAEASGSTVTLSWDTPATTASFQLFRSVDGGMSTAVTTTNSDVTSFIQTNVEDGAYTYSLYAFDDYDNPSNAGIATVTVDTTPPSAPAVVAAVDSSNVFLSWDVPATTAAFTLRRSTDGFPVSRTDGTAVTTTVSSVTSFTQTGMADGTYYYSLFASDAFGNYSASGTASVVVDTTGPAAPTGFSATATGTTINLAWSNPIDSDFDSTIIRRSTITFPTSITDGSLVTSTIATSFADLGLSDGSYYYSIFALDTRENVSSLATSSAIIDTTPPETPVLAAIADGSSAHLTWNIPVGTATFILRQSVGEDPSVVTVTTTSSDVTSYTQSALADETYHYHLFAVDDYGNSSSAGTASVTIDTTAPASPTSFSTIATGTTVHLSWSNPPDGDFASSTIRRSTSSFPATISAGTLATSTSATSFSDTDLIDGVYYYSIFAADSRGNISSAATSSVTIDTTAPESVTGISATASSSSIILAWTNPSLDFDSVTLRRSTSTYPLTVSGGTAVTSSFTGAAFTDTSLADGSYYYSLFAVDAFGNISTAATATAIVDTTAPILSSVTSTVSSSTVMISWDTNEAASTQVTYAIDTAASSTPRTDVETGTSHHEVTLRSLRACTTYQYRVISTDMAGNTATSTAQSFVTENCPGGASIIFATTTNIAIGERGTGRIISDQGTLTVETAIGFSSATSNIVLQMQSLNAPTVLAGLGRPSFTFSGGTLVFDITLFQEAGGGVIETPFETPVRITYQYNPSDVAHLDRATLRLYHYHDSAWSPLNDCTIDSNEHTVSCTTDSFSIFGLFGREPAPVVSSSGGSGGGAYTYPFPLSVLPPQRTVTPTTPVASRPIIPPPAPSPIVKPTSTKATSTLPLFTKTLKAGIKGADVKALQIFLNRHGFTVATKGAGSAGKESDVFGPATTAALKRFQEKYAAQILKPYGLKKGTGIFGTSTMAVVNKMR